MSLGVWLIIATGVVAGALLLMSTTTIEDDRERMELWVFADMHVRLYEPVIERWNKEQGGAGAPAVEQTMLGVPALQRRMLAGFFGGLPTADLIEVERTMAGQLFAGPIDSVGFVDLTGLLEREDLLGQIPAASYTPWTTRGRIFGLPHDVHPVLLGVRMDILEEAGLTLDGVETWSDLIDALRPLVTDADGDGEIDRYLLAFWPNDMHREKIEALLLQSGGGLFDTNGQPTIATETHARTLATMVSWCVGPDRIAADVRDFQATGNQLKADGYAVAYFMPDWMCNVWRNELPSMAGTLEIVPLPAAEPGGRRASVWGGTMLGIPKTAPDFDAAWRFAKHLYFSPELARELYTKGDIVTPNRSFWDDPVFDTPDPYYRGQRKGRLYIDHIEQVPARNASPFNQTAMVRIANASTALLRYAEREGFHEPDDLEEEAMRQLKIAERGVRRLMARNLFVGEEVGGEQPVVEALNTTRDATNAPEAMP